MGGVFDGNLSLVTGGASGIGRAIALMLAREGSAVILVDIDREGLEAVSREIDPTGNTVSWYIADVSDAVQVERLYELVSSEIGTPDILVNSAGVAMSGAIDEVSLADWRWLMGVNLWGVIHTVHYFIGDMYDRGSGHVVNMASAAGLFALPQAPLYSTSKHAVVGLSGVLRAEASVHGVGVTAVCPGFVLTPMLDDVKSADPQEKAADDSAAARRIAMSADRLADKVLAGMIKNRPIVTCPFYIKVMHGVSKYLPRLWDTMMKATAKAGHKAKQAAG